MTTMKQLIATSFMGFSVLSGAALAQSDYYGNGYTIIAAANDDSDLDAVVYRVLPQGTVQNALYALLEGTGYRLAETYAADPRIFRLYNQPMADHKKRIGPMSLDKALTWIAGDAWALVVDPINRLVSFEVKDQYITYVNRPRLKNNVSTATASKPPAVNEDLVSSEYIQTVIEADQAQPAIFPIVEDSSGYDFSNFIEATSNQKKRGKK